MFKPARQLITENKQTKSTFLDLADCGLTEIPLEIGELVWLESLAVGRLNPRLVDLAPLFVSLFFTKTGKFTEEEFDAAFDAFAVTRKPRIYTYFKNAPVSTGDLGDEFASLLDFKKRLEKLGHFWTNYETVSDLQLQFRDQLDKLCGPGEVLKIATSRSLPITARDRRGGTWQ
jgi:hypothetical protein